MEDLSKRYCITGFYIEIFYYDQWDKEIDTDILPKTFDMKLNRIDDGDHLIMIKFTEIKNTKNSRVYSVSLITQSMRLSIFFP